MAPYETLPMIYESYPFISPDRFAGQLKGKVVLVTGASAGIGRYICTAFGKTGASVACVARREGNLNALVDEIEAQGGHAIAVVADVSARGAPQDIVAKVENQLGPVDILINNAGITRLGALELEDEALDTWWRIYEVNVRAPVALIRAVLPGMQARKQGGVVMSVSSSVATMNLPAMTAYASSKAAISKFHELLTHELEETGVLSFAVHPGLVDTELAMPEDALNKASMEHSAVKKFMTHIYDPNVRRQAPELSADTCVALAAEPRCAVLSGRHVNADQDLEGVVQEAEKEGKGRIGKEDLYLVRIGAL